MHIITGVFYSARAYCDNNQTIATRHDARFMMRVSDEMMKALFIEQK